jgi:hypothetical protein
MKEIKKNERNLPHKAKKKEICMRVREACNNGLK